MKVKVSNKMREVIREAFPDCDVSLDKITRESYAVNVDYDLDRNAVDLDAKTGKMKVITINYPGEYYAIPAQVTTRDLIRIFRQASDNTLDAFKRELKAAYMI